MTGYEQFLVVVLATFLAIFLLLGIIVLILAIKVMLAVKRITRKAEKFADKAGAIGDFFSRASGPLAVARVMSFVADTLFRRKAGHNTKRKG
jgi:hypothetical protein